MSGPVLNILRSREMEFGPLNSESISATGWAHWRLARDGQEVVWLLLDRQDSSVNSLSEAVLQELDEILNRTPSGRGRCCRSDLLHSGAS